MAIYDELNEKSVHDLRRIARKLDIEGRSRLTTKQLLIEAILKSGNEGTIRGIAVLSWWERHSHHVYGAVGVASLVVAVLGCILARKAPFIGQPVSIGGEGDTQLSSRRSGSHNISVTDSPGASVQVVPPNSTLSDTPSQESLSDEERVVTVVRPSVDAAASPPDSDRVVAHQPSESLADSKPILDGGGLRRSMRLRSQHLDHEITVIADRLQFWRSAPNDFYSQVLPVLRNIAEQVPTEVPDFSVQVDGPHTLVIQSEEFRGSRQHVAKRLLRLDVSGPGQRTNFYFDVQCLVWNPVDSEWSKDWNPFVFQFAFSGDLHSGHEFPTEIIRVSFDDHGQLYLRGKTNELLGETTQAKVIEQIQGWIGNQYVWRNI